MKHRKDRCDHNILCSFASLQQVLCLDCCIELVVLGISLAEHKQQQLSRGYHDHACFPLCIQLTVASCFVVLHVVFAKVWHMQRCKGLHYCCF